MRAGERILTFGQAQARPRLSFLIAYRDRDPSALIAALDATANDAELIVLSEGGDAARAAHAIAAIEGSHIPARFIVREQCAAYARQRLVAEARARHVLFLDPDLSPLRADFVAKWIDVIDARCPALACGGVKGEAKAETNLLARRDIFSDPNWALTPARALLRIDNPVRRVAPAGEEGRCAA